jgi:hypothetical protein
VIWKAVLAWVPMVGIAILNGAVREAWYGQRLSELHAHQLSTVSGLVLFGAYIWVVMRVWPPTSPRQAIGVGLTWLALTVAFEFLFGRYVVGHPWSRLFHDYNLLAGRLWVCILLWIAVAPYVVFRLQRRRPR